MQRGVLCVYYNARTVGQTVAYVVGAPCTCMGERGIAGRLRLAGQSRCDSVRW